MYKMDWDARESRVHTVLVYKLLVYRNVRLMQYITLNKVASRLKSTHRGVKGNTQDCSAECKSLI